jgi:hypothetical protein
MIMMRQILIAFVLTATVLTSSLRAHAAGETGHSDLMRLIAAIYGLQLDAADYLATINQSVDKVPLSAATQSGRASAKLHFGTVVTESDLDEKDLAKLLQNSGKRTFSQVLMMFLKNNAMGGGVASLGNAESAEALGKAMKTGDGMLFGMGLHYLLDVAAPFHDGYLGALGNPIPLINKLPFLHQFAFGHLADGTSPDRLSIGKIVIAMDAMGPFLIALRNSQKGEIGVNSKWLNQLQAQGVDVNDSESIRNWFMSQPEVKEVLQTYIPANRSVDYTKVIIGELRERLIDLKFFNDKAYMDEKLKELVEQVQQFKEVNDTKTSVNDLIFKMIDQAWAEGKLNEKQVIKETTTDYFGLFETTESLSDLLFDPKYEGLPEYAQEAVSSQLQLKNSRPMHTRGWIVDQIVAKITREMINQSWEKFNTAYLNENVEKAQIKIEQEAIGKIEKAFFKRTGKYSYNPGVEYWAKVKEVWSSMPKAEKGRTFLEKIITYCDVVVKTRLYDGKEIHSLDFATKAQIFMKTMKYIFKEEYVDPRTSKGNFAVRIKKFRDRIVQQIQREFPEGLLTEKMLMRSREYNAFVNKKFNSDDAVGIRQNIAVGIKKTAELLQRMTGKNPHSGQVLRCEAIFN